MDFKRVSFKEFMDSLNNPDLSKPSPIIFFVYNSRGLQLVKVILFGGSCTSGTLVPVLTSRLFLTSTFLYPAKRLQEKACEF